MSNSTTSSDVFETVLLHYNTVEDNEVISKLLLFLKTQLAQFGQQHSHRCISWVTIVFQQTPSEQIEFM